MVLTVKIRHRIHEPSGVVAQLLEDDNVLEERKFDENDQRDQELLREATAVAAESDDERMIQLLFPDHLP
jgi:hypothetical protein